MSRYLRACQCQSLLSERSSAHLRVNELDTQSQHKMQLPEFQQSTYPILDVLPDDPRHLISIQLHHRVLDLDLTPFCRHPAHLSSLPRRRNRSCRRKRLSIRSSICRTQWSCSRRQRSRNRAPRHRTTSLTSAHSCRSESERCGSRPHDGWSA
jgi:hypothetical protein